MRNISKNDTMMIRVSSIGREIVGFTMDGFSDLNDVMREVCNRLDGFRGLMQLNLRNSTQGWSDTRAIYI